MRLFHFTLKLHLESILRERAIKPTDPATREHSEFFLRYASGEFGNIGLVEAIEQHPNHDLGTPVVHLTRNPSIAAQRWGEAVDFRGNKTKRYGKIWTSQIYQRDKREIRFEVDVPGPIRYRRFAIQDGISETWYRHLRRTGGDDSDWFVVSRPILAEEWVCIEDVTTGKILWRKGQDLDVLATSRC